jgi:bacterioferritin
MFTPCVDEPRLFGRICAANQGGLANPGIAGVAWAQPRSNESMNKNKSIELLNQGVADELQAVHQYMYWHFHLDDQGFGPLALLLKRIAIEEMGHVERLAERILFLKGDVKMVTAGPVEKITEAQKILAKAAEMEQAGVASYNQAAIQCSQNADAVSKQLFEALVGDEERHFDQFDKQLDNIKRFGPNYLALQSFDQGKGEPAQEP